LTFNYDLDLEPAVCPVKAGQDEYGWTDRQTAKTMYFGRHNNYEIYYIFSNKRRSHT
jgi:hypothetical protein